MVEYKFAWDYPVVRGLPVVIPIPLQFVELADDFKDYLPPKRQRRQLSAEHKAWIARNQ